MHVVSHPPFSVFSLEKVFLFVLRAEEVTRHADGFFLVSVLICGARGGDGSQGEK